jgi:glycosyltransferase involved in cell wall biosynthesis
LDAGWPLSDADQFSTNLLKKFRYFKNLIIDFCAIHSAHKIFVESETQNIRIRRKFLVSAKKVSTRYTGVLERQFLDSNPASVSELESTFLRGIRPKIVLFRGKLNFESGIESLGQIARQLNPGIVIVLVTHNAPSITSSSENLLVINRFLDPREIAHMYRCSSLALGQLGESPRINWTIPHKFFESAYFGVPYLCLASDSIREIVNSEDVFFLRDSNPTHIAQAINTALSDDSVLAEKRRRLKATYDTYLSNEKLVEKFMIDITY